MTEPTYPKGTPEYDAYATELRRELKLFAAGADPYPYDTTAAPTLAEIMNLVEKYGDYRQSGAAAGGWREQIEEALRHLGAQ